MKAIIGKEPTMPSTRRYRAVMPVAIGAILLVLTLAMWSCGGSSTTTTGGATTTAVQPGEQVTIRNLAFDPQNVTVKVGEAVTWTNEDSMTHTVVADNGEFQSENLVSGAAFIFTFDTAGTFAYHCSIHPTMTGTVVVQ
jgi:plastocyanin